MLSILIPIYNYKSLPLIEEIHDQLIQSTIEFEIICMDDHSDSEFLISDVQMSSLTHTFYKVLDKNLGRSKIRNALAKEARFGSLLFLDADTMPVSKGFIKNYLDALQQEYKVICGGIQYQSEKPKDENVLRYVYGKKREEKSLAERKQNPYRYVLASNFLISKQTFLDIKFNENITQYGHEDTLLAIDLKRKNIKVMHIDNPTYHLGLETNCKFLEKTEKAVKNALFLYQQKLIAQTDIKLIDKFIELQFFKRPIIFLFSIFKKSIIKQLGSNNPSLFLFDVYKLGFLCGLKKESP